MKNDRILPIGSSVIAKKDQFMEGNNEQFLTKDKIYTIIQNPHYYKYPIVITDDQGIPHSCPTKYFK
jgi:hypothetical protein